MNDQPDNNLVYRVGDKVRVKSSVWDGLLQIYKVGLITGTIERLPEPPHRKAYLVTKDEGNHPIHTDWYYEDEIAPLTREDMAKELAQ